MFEVLSSQRLQTVTKKHLKVLIKLFMLQRSTEFSCQLSHDGASEQYVI